MNTNVNPQQFSLKYLLLLVAGAGTSIAFSVVPLLQGDGWLRGYGSLILFFIGILVSFMLIASLAKRLMPLLVWPVLLAGFLAIASCVFLIWYIQTSIPTFESLGFDADDEITFKKIGWDRGFVIIKYTISDPPDCEIVSYLSSQRNGNIGEIKY